MLSVVRNAKLQEVEYVCHINNDMCTREKPSYERRETPFGITNRCDCSNTERCESKTLS